jgi:catechol 2,3-dioxygenase-like lactoylglutathione lyase family enzyme
MSIERVLINVADVSRSVDFYTRFLDAQVVGTVTADRALLDVVTATIELVRIENSEASSWDRDDLQRGFRHIGFKVAKLDPLVADLKAANVPFHLDPLDAEGNVRISFFFDPDGTLLEFVEGALQYHEVVDRAGVDADWALGVPDRPRFDHVAETVDEFAPTRDYYGQFGFQHIGTIHQPADPRGFEINFLKSGDSVLEIFTYDKAEKHLRAPQLGAPGFVAVSIRGAAPDAPACGSAPSGARVFADADGLLYTVIA